MGAHCLIVAVTLCSRYLLAVDAPVLHSVSVSKAFFNPTLGQKVDFSFTVEAEGLLTISILDRDGFLVRTLVSGEPQKPGKVIYGWDGRDDQRRLVADEAYSPKVDLKISGQMQTYFPARQLVAEIVIPKSSYDRQSAILAYRLPAASRVLIAAVSAKLPEKIIVNWEPRSAGSVIDTWNGYDSTGKTYLPDQPEFAISIKAKALPEGSIIAVGNAAETFAQYASRRRGVSLLGAAHSGGN